MEVQREESTPDTQWDTAIFPRYIVCGREAHEQEASFLDRQNRDEATAPNYDRAFKEYKKNAKKMKERCVSEDLPEDFLDRMAYDVSVERFCKWLIEKAAERRGRFNEHVPLRAVGFMLSIGTYISYRHIYVFNVFLSLTFTY